MHTTEQPYATAHRGTIIVDTSALLLLYAQTGTHKTLGEPNRYWDILRFLGEQGFRIIIPDMVAFEAERVLSSGESVNRAFRHRLRSHRPELESFLRDIAHGKYPNMLIYSAGGPKYVKDTLRDIEKALWYHDKRGPASLQKIRELQSGIVGDSLQFGDDTIEYLLNHPGQAHLRHKPLFLLTDDIHFINRFSNKGRHPRVGLLTTGGLFEALCSAGLQKRIYATEHLQRPNKMKHDCQRQKEKYDLMPSSDPQNMREESHENKPDRNIMEPYERRAIDCSVENYHNYGGDVRKRRELPRTFANLMHDLAKELRGSNPKYGERKYFQQPLTPRRDARGNVKPRPRQTLGRDDEGNGPPPLPLRPDVEGNARGI